MMSNAKSITDQRVTDCCRCGHGWLWHDDHDELCEFHRCDCIIFRRWTGPVRCQACHHTEADHKTHGGPCVAMVAGRGSACPCNAFVDPDQLATAAPSPSRQIRIRE